jgi:ABC-type Fe3+ transport system permease subunit
MNTPKIFEWSRIIGISAGIFFAYQAGNGDAKTTLHFLSFFIIVVMAGLTGIEGLFFGKASAESMGRKSDPQYQKQSGGANLAFAITALLVFLFNWGLYADATILIATLIFFVISAIVHTWDIFATKNRSVKNALRPLLTLALLAACAWPLLGSLVPDH